MEGRSDDRGLDQIGSCASLTGNERRTILDDLLYSIVQ